MKSKHWLEYGCHCFADIKNDILTPGHGRTIDKIGIDISRTYMILIYNFKPKRERYVRLSAFFAENSH